MIRTLQVEKMEGGFEPQVLCSERTNEAQLSCMMSANGTKKVLLTASHYGMLLAIGAYSHPIIGVLHEAQ